MHDVDYYAEHYPMPAFCFTPDAEFPVCNGEKGGFNGEIVSPKFEKGIITAFEGGVAHNAVPDRASCTVQVGAGALVQTEGVTFEAGEGGSTVIRGWGKSGHAAMPEGTVNAISLIVDCLLKSGVCTLRRKPTCRCCTPCTPPPMAAPWALPQTTACLTR